MKKSLVFLSLVALFTHCQQPVPTVDVEKEKAAIRAVIAK
jgi:hypothetical protein